MIRIVRWIIAIPAGIAASFLLHMFSVYGFSLGHGFDEVSALLNSIDMNGMPLRGTYILLISRLVSSAALVGSAVFIVPKYKKIFGIVLVTIVTIFAISFLIFLIHQALSLKIPLGPSAWYRNILEMVGIIAGNLTGLYIGLSSDRQKESYRDREEPHGSPLPHHAAYGSVLRGSADQAGSDPGERKSK